MRIPVLRETDARTGSHLPGCGEGGARGTGGGKLGPWTCRHPFSVQAGAEGALGRPWAPGVAQGPWGGLVAAPASASSAPCPAAAGASLPRRRERCPLPRASSQAAGCRGAAPQGAPAWCPHVCSEVTGTWTGLSKLKSCPDHRGHSDP